MVSHSLPKAETMPSKVIMVVRCDFVINTKQVTNMNEESSVSSSNGNNFTSVDVNEEQSFQNDKS